MPTPKRVPKQLYVVDGRPIDSGVVTHEPRLMAAKFVSPYRMVKWETMWEGTDSQDVGLEAAII